MMKEIERRKRIYRIFCIVVLVLAFCLMVGLLQTESAQERSLILFFLLAAVIIWGLVDWSQNSRRMLQQARELRNYQTYIQPLEEMVKEIRATQHEFDNHLNTLLHMHLTISSYEELVQRQASYIDELQRDSRRQLLPLLRISDKVLAGFLYSKIVAMPEWIDVQLNVYSSEILCGVSENDIIEILGTLVDNAVEACTEEKRKIHMALDSEDGRLIFEVENRVDHLSLPDTGRFFERGYSSKTTAGKLPASGRDNRGKRGYGLYNAKNICERHGGSITVALPRYDDGQYISFRLEL